MIARRTLLGRLAALTIGLTAPLTGAAQAAAIEPPPEPAAGGVTYRISGRTGAVANAGTDGNVGVRLYGSKGVSPWVWLDDYRDNWERDYTDVFYSRLTDVGTVQRICVQFERGDGRYGDWYLEWFDVNGVYFQYYRWFTADATVCRNAS